MCHAFEIVTLTVSEVIHGIDFPGVAGTPVGSLDDAVHDRVAEVHVVTRHVDLCTEHHGSLVELPLVHSLEQIQILFRRTVAERTFCPWTCGSPFLFGDLFAGLFVDVCLSLFDHTHGEVVQLGEIVARIV